MMALLNYTTKVPVEKTIGEIESMLAKSGASKILKDYDTEGNITSISFKILTEKGELPFKLPMNLEGVMQTINNQTGEYRRQKSRTGGYGQQVRVVPQSMHNDFNQARKVGWRIMRDWLEAQLAIFFLQMVKIEEIFLPYMYNEKTGQTMFQTMEKQNFNMQLEHSQNRSEEKDDKNL